MQFAALDTGVIVKYPGTAKWEYTPGIDTIVAYDLTYDDATQTLYASTKYGLWKWQMQTAVKEFHDPTPPIFTLGQSYPNPANGSTNIPFQLQAGGNYNLILSDECGKELRNMPLGKLMQGDYNISVNMKNLSSGEYFYTVQNKSQQRTRILSVIH
ncbi:MAG TPA: T9SS type A sorting domain-containing protein [Candidatus Kapabacteria bacterium]|nr:T9SS type A sorting domain-containing protein [Candidatus Kapabacteria bacterium]